MAAAPTRTSARTEVPDFFLAGEYVPRTGRPAVNALLDADNSDAELRYGLGLPNTFDLG